MKISLNILPMDISNPSWIKHVERVVMMMIIKVSGVIFISIVPVRQDKKTINPSSLWKSFRDKTERGVTEIEYGLLGTFGVPWQPYRFSFGRWDNLWQHIPSILMFNAILWCSYFFSFRVHFWLNANAFDLPRALNYFVRILDFVPKMSKSKNHAPNTWPRIPTRLLPIIWRIRMMM